MVAIEMVVIMAFLTMVVTIEIVGVMMMVIMALMVIMVMMMLEMVVIMVMVTAILRIPVGLCVTEKLESGEVAPQICPLLILTVGLTDHLLACSVGNLGCPHGVCTG